MSSITPKSPSELLKEYEQLDDELERVNSGSDWLNEAFASVIAWSSKEATKLLDAVVPKDFDPKRGWFSGVNEHEKAVIAIAESLRK